MQDTPDTPEERLQRRRVRRWKRRARIMGPFVGVSLLLLTLALSVDLIEYQPQKEPDRLTDRPIRMTQPKTTQPGIRPGLSPTSPTDTPIPIPQDGAMGIGSDSVDFEFSPPSAASLRLPTPPYAMKRPQ